MGRKLKTVTLYAASGRGHAHVFGHDIEPGMYVPADVAQGLLEALLLAQWGETGMRCPYCENSDLDGHHEDCKIGTAIAAATGEE